MRIRASITIRGMDCDQPVAIERIMTVAPDGVQTIGPKPTLPAPARSTRTMEHPHTHRSTSQWPLRMPWEHHCTINLT